MTKLERAQKAYDKAQETSERLHNDQCLRGGWSTDAQLEEMYKADNIETRKFELLLAAENLSKS